MTSVDQDPQPAAQNPQSPQGPQPSPALQAMMAKVKAASGDPQGQEPQDPVADYVAGMKAGIISRSRAAWQNEAHGWAIPGYLAAKTGNTIGNALYDMVHGIGELLPKPGWSPISTPGVENKPPEFLATPGDKGYADLVNQSIRGIEPPTGYSTWRQAMDAKYQQKLGSKAIAGDVVGNLLAMSVGPGKLIGEGAAAVMSGVVERTAGKMMARGVMTAEEAAKAVQEGTLLAKIAASPEWAANATVAQKLALQGSNLLSPTAALVAQSYAMAPDSERTRAALGAAVLAPLMAPLGAMGNWIGGKLADRTLTAESRATLLAAQEALNGGGGPTRAAKIRAAINMLPANLAASMFEGSAFAGLQLGTSKDGLDTLVQAYQGDPDAQARLIAMTTGSVAGVLMLKHAVPPEQIPFVNRLRPDLSLVKVAAEAVDTSIPISVGHVPESPEQLKDVSVPTGVYEPKADTTSQRAANAMHPIVGETHALRRSGWSVDPAEMTVGQNEAQAVFRFGRDGMLMLNHKPGGEVQVTTTPELLAKIAGNTEIPHETLSPGMVAVNGEDVPKLLDRASLLGLASAVKARADLGASGFRDVGDHQFFDDAHGLYYRANLDGTLDVRGPTQDWRPAGALDVTHRPNWDYATVPGNNVVKWTDWLAAKRAVSPDPLVDPVIEQCVALALHGNMNDTATADLRAFIQAVSPEAAQGLLRPGSDRTLALTMGQIGAGEINAETGMARIGRGQEHGGGPAEEPPTSPTTEPTGGAPEGSAKPVETPLTTVMESYADAEAARPKAGEPAVTPERAAELARSAEIPKEAESGSGITGRTLRSMMDALTKKRLPELEEQPASAPAGKPKLPGNEAVRRGALTNMAERQFVPPLQVMREYVRDPQARALLDRLDTASSQADAIRGSWRQELKGVERALKAARGAAMQTRRDTVMPTFEFTVARAVTEGLSEAKTPQEIGMRDALRAFSKKAWNTAREIGVQRMGPNGPEPLPESEGNRMPRMAGQDLGTVLGSPELRNEFARQLGERNPDMTGLTGDKLKEMFSELTPGKRESAEKEAQLESFRRIQVMPDVWVNNGRRYEITESHPQRLVDQWARRYSGRLGLIKMVGQDMPEGVVTDPSRPGITRTLSAIENAIEGGADTRALKDILERATTRLQGGSSIPLWRVVKATMGLSSVARAVKSRWSGLQDPGDVMVQAGIVPARLVALGSVDVLRSPREMVDLAHMRGILDESIATSMMEAVEGGSLLTRLAAKASKVNTLTEVTKGAAAMRVADRVLRDVWGEGADPAWGQNLVRITGLSEEKGAALRSGTASEEVQHEFVKKFVETVTGRRTGAQLPDNLANPNLQWLVPFQKFFSGRVRLITRTYAQIAEAKTPEQRRAAMASVVKLTVGSALNAGLGSLLTYVVSDLFKGRNGAARFASELGNLPGYMLMNLATQAVGGGPVASAVQAAKHPETVSDWAQPFQMADWLLNAAEAAKSAGPYSGLDSGDKLRLWLQRVGLVPFGSELRSAANAAIFGVDNAMADQSDLSSWKQKAGLDTSGGDAKNKPEDYYIALRSAKDEIRKALSTGTDPQTAARAASAQLLRALAIEPGKTVSESLKYAQHFAGMRPEDIDAFRQVVGDATVSRMMARDSEIAAIAAGLAKMEGTTPKPLDQQIATAVNLAKIGNAKALDTVIHETIARESVRLRTGQPFGDEALAVAEQAGAFPQALEGMVTPREFLVLKDANAHVATAMLYRIMLTQAKARAKQDLREEVTPDLLKSTQAVGADSVAAELRSQGAR